jgi:Mg2+-importing ATPase
LPVTVAAARPVDDVLAQLGATAAGLSTAEANRRLATQGPNAVRSHRARALPVLWHQIRSPLLGLLLAAALASVFVGERGDAVIIAVIVGLSVGLGFVNELRAERAAQALHSRVRHTAPGGRAVQSRDRRRDHPATAASHRIDKPGGRVSSAGPISEFS